MPHFGWLSKGILAAVTVSGKVVKVLQNENTKKARIFTTTGLF